MTSSTTMNSQKIDGSRHKDAKNAQEVKPLLYANDHGAEVYHDLNLIKEESLSGLDSDKSLKSKSESEKSRSSRTTQEDKKSPTELESEKQGLLTTNENSTGGKTAEIVDSELRHEKEVPGSRSNNANSNNPNINNGIPESNSPDTNSDDNTAISLDRCNFSWDVEGNGFTLKDISLNIEKGGWNIFLMPFRTPCNVGYLRYA